jgi:hypothetical protein
LLGPQAKTSIRIIIQKSYTVLGKELQLFSGGARIYKDSAGLGSHI